jgi:hypothetical protein
LQALADPFDAGPYTRIQRSIRVIGVSAPRAGKRAALAALIAWFPLIVLSALEGVGIGPTPRDSMWLDIASHARYLVAVPLLVLAESFCLPGLAGIANHLGAAGMVAETSRARYQELLDSTRRLLASPFTGVAIAALAYALTVLMPSPVTVGGDTTWIAPTSIGSRGLSLAGWWRTLVSHPLFSILQLAWLWRIVLWGRFLYGVSRLDLKLTPAHPDGVAGLGFFGASLRFFIVPAFALAVPLAGAVAQEIQYGGRTLFEFRFIIAALLVAELILFTAPLLFLTPRLIGERARGVFQYGALAAAVGARFERRWLQEIGSVADDTAMAVPDFSATTDLYSIAANVNQMQVVPASLPQIARLILAVLLPFLPALVMTMPVRDILEHVAKFVL